MGNMASVQKQLLHILTLKLQTRLKAVQLISVNGWMDASCLIWDSCCSVFLDYHVSNIQKKSKFI